MFNEEQKKLLSAPLDSRVTKQLKDGPMKGASYIEAYHAINEANRIFGFDGWSCETVLMQCSATANYMKKGWNGGPDVPMIEVGYNCKVRITVGDIVREGCGNGTGQGKRPAQAHESASKEAESDAIKRALRSFGNQFGLALYDKQKTNVETDADRAAKPKPQSEPANQNKRMSKTDEARKTFERIKGAIASKKSIPELDKFKSNHHTKAALASLPEDWERDIKAAISTQEHMLSMAAADNHEKEHA